MTVSGKCELENMTPIFLYIDADACPVKQEIYRVAERHAGKPGNRRRSRKGRLRLGRRGLGQADAEVESVGPLSAQGRIAEGVVRRPPGIELDVTITET